MTKYVIFGSGRVGRNMASYLEHLGHGVRIISRREAQSDQTACAAHVEKADIIAAAIPDDKLESWRDEWRPSMGDKIAIHFSGAIAVDGVYSFHPLYSFPKSALSIEKIKSIAFACPSAGPAFNEIFPNAPNPHFEIAEKDRARYHALAVLSGNLVSYIWNETAKDFASLSSAPSERIMESYLNSIVERFVENPTNSLTGPIARRDRVTVNRNLAGLSNSPELKKLYEAFLETAWPDFDKAEPR